MVAKSKRSLLPESQILRQNSVGGYPAIEILSGTSTPNLAAGVAQMLAVKVGHPVQGRFANGQIRVRIENPLAKRHVFIIQSTPADEHILELIFMLDAARRASAQQITAVIPYFAYAQSDRKTTSGEPIAAAALARIFEFSGAARLVTIDPHYDQIQGTISAPFDILFASWSMVPVIKHDLNPDIKNGNLAVVAPDEGAGKRGRKWAQMLGVPWAGSFPKDRDPETGKSTALDLASVKAAAGQKILLVDDVWVSGGTIFDLLPIIKRMGIKDIYVAVSHSFFAKDSLSKLSASPIKKVYVSNTIPHRREVINHPKVEIIDVAPLIAQAVLDIYTGDRHQGLFL